MAARLRTGPQGLPVFQPDSRASILLSGGSRKRLVSNITTLYQSFLFSIWVKPTTNGTQRHIISKNRVNADSVDDFPVRLELTSGNLASLVLSNGGDFAADLTLTSDVTVRSGAWTHLCAAYSSPGAHLWVNGVYKTSSSALTLSGASWPYTVGNSAFDSASAGADSVIYSGYVFDPRLYNWNGYGFQEQAARLMAGEDLRGGLIYEWMPKDIPNLRRARAYGS
jgi:hypothetical protein